MALVKEALLSLKLQGFAQAEAAAKRVAVALLMAQRAANTLGAQAGRLRAPIGPALPLALPRAGGGAVPGLPQPGGPAGDGGGAAELPGAAGAATAFARLQAAGVGAAKAIRGSFASAGIAVASVGAAVFGVFKALGKGEGVAAVSSSFDRLAAATGGAAATMAALEWATGGGVAKQELMTAANRLLVANLGVSRERMEALFTAGTRLGRALGVNATDATNRLSLALSKQEPELLDELGLKVDLTKAIHDYAEANGVAVESIDAQQRSVIFLNAVEAQAAERSAALGDSVAAAAAPTERLAKKWADMTDKFALMLTQQPGIFAGLEAIAGAALGLLTALTPIVKILASIVELLTAIPGLVPGLAGAAAGFVAGGPVGALIGGGIGAVGGIASAIGGSGAVGGVGSLAAAGGAGGAGGLTVNVTVPIADEGFARTARTVGEAVAGAARSRIEDARGALERGLKRGLDGSFANAFTG